MRKRTKKLMLDACWYVGVLAVAAGLVMVGAAAAGAAPNHTPGRYVTVAEITDAILDDDWAFDNDIEDVDCQGRQKPRLNAVGEPTFKHFVCRFAYTIDGYMDDGYTYSDGQTCRVRFQAHATRYDWEMSGWRDTCGAYSEVLRS